MSIKSLEIKNWKDFSTEILDKFDPTLGKEIMVYRGQPNYKYTLRPSILRYFKDGSSTVVSKLDIKKLPNLEIYTIEEFKQFYYSHKPNNHSYPKNTLEWLIVMQHYGCPTRLLDWSLSPLVGLYFAVNQDFENDGALFLLKPDSFLKKQKLKMNEAGFKYPLKNIDQYIDQQNPIAQMSELNYIDIDKLFRTKVYDFRYLMTLRKDESFERTQNQQSVFTFSNDITSDHDNFFNELCTKYIIRKESKIEILRKLNRLNVNGLSLFPGLEGVTKHIKESLDYYTDEFKLKF